MRCNKEKIVKGGLENLRKTWSWRVIKVRVAQIIWDLINGWVKSVRRDGQRILFVIKKLKRKVSITK